MSERDELADEIAGFHIGSGYYSVDVGFSAALEIADAILAAGYRKPRIITTTEELDALAVGSVVLDSIGISLHRNAFNGWCASNGAKDISPEFLGEALPATVLYEPPA